MVNTVDKGRRSERKCLNTLLADGWLVHSSRRGFKGQPIDIWGLFDKIAHKEGYIRLIQVKSNYCEPQVRERIRAFLTDGRFVTKEIWVYKDYDRSGPKIEVVR